VQLQDPRSHALVVVDDVEVTTSALQDLLDAQRIRERLAEAAAHHDAELRKVSEGRELARGRDPKRIGVAVEVEAAHGREADALIELGPRGSGKDLDAVAEFDQFARQVSGVDALTAAARVATVDQERHAVLARFGRPGRHVGRRDDALGAGPGRLGLVDGLAQGTGQGATFGFRSPPFSPNSPKPHKCPLTIGFHRDYIVRMDLNYPAETEPFRKEVRAWLEENLPEGWFDPDFSMNPEERRAFNEGWNEKLFAGGWICAGWPVEYGGKGLTLLQQVVLNEEFAKAAAPMRADFFGDTLVGPTILQWAPMSRSASSFPASSKERSPGARVSPNPTPLGLSES